MLIARLRVLEANTMRRRSRKIVVFCTMVGLAAFAPATRAQADTGYDETTQRAVVEFNRGNWEEAQALFRRAHELSPNARTWRGLGICAFELRQYVEATGELEAALLDPHKPLTAEQRDQVKTLLAEARGFVSIYHVRVRPPDAEVWVDGRLVELRDDELHLDPGPHTVLVRAPGYEERRAEFRAGAGVQDELSIELSVTQREPESTTHARALERPSAPAPERPRRVWTWTLAGGAFASAAAAVALRLRVLDVEAEYEKCRRANGNCGVVSAYGDRLWRASYATAAVAGTLALGATLSFWLEGERSGPHQVALTVGGEGVQLRGSF
ncbi:MAG: hypothetical protein RLZZ450_6309 [Pseudomonadota bacterium]|jgi:tetratricopeptide (TPR) repeat protein